MPFQPGNQLGKRHTPATKAQIQALLDSRPTTYAQIARKVILYLGLYQGFGPDEIRHLTMADVDLDRGIIFKDFRPYPISGSAQVLASWLKIRRWRPGVISLITTPGGYPRLNDKSPGPGLANLGAYRAYYRLSRPKNPTPDRAIVNQARIFPLRVIKR